MGLFGGGYDKPGKGVDKNAPKKKGFFLFWDIVFHKFTKFLQLNSMYSILSIIWVFILYYFAALVISGHPDFIEGVAARLQIEGASVSDIQSMVVFGFGSVFAVGIFLLWGAGPVSAAFSYIVRCFTRGEHTWIMSDGRDKFKENFKQGLVVVLIDAVVLLFGINALYFYYSAYIAYGSFMWMVLCYVTFLLMIIFTMLHPYVYQLMVTFECSVIQLYKSAILLTFGKLPVNFLLTLIEALLVFIVFSAFSPAIAILFSLILGPCIMRFPGEFYAARVIEKSILNDMKEKTPSVKITYMEDDEI